MAIRFFARTRPCPSWDGFTAIWRKPGGEGFFGGDFADGDIEDSLELGTGTTLEGEETISEGVQPINWLGCRGSMASKPHRFGPKFDGLEHEGIGDVGGVFG